MVLNIRAYGHEYIYINTVVMGKYNFAVLQLVYHKHRQKGFSEMFGVFIGMYLILYTRRRWLWTGLFSMAAGVLAYLTWLIPENRK